MKSALRSVELCAAALSSTPPAQCPNGEQHPCGAGGAARHAVALCVGRGLLPLQIAEAPHRLAGMQLLHRSGFKLRTTDVAAPAIDPVREPGSACGAALPLSKAVRVRN